MQSKILIVDDEQSIRNLLADFLSDNGYETMVSASADEALHILSTDSFDIVITDIKMPNTNGLEFIEKASQIEPDIVFIVITGYATLENAMAAIRMGAYDYIVKPFDVVQIKNAVNLALERKQMMEENAKSKQVEELYKFSEIINSFLDKKKILLYFLETALKQVNATRGSIMLYDKEENCLRIAAATGLDTSIINSAKISIGEGIAGWVAEHAIPLLIPNIKEHPYFSHLGRNLQNDSFMSIPLEKMADESESQLSLPVKTKRDLLGVINITGKEEGTSFKKTDVEILSMMAAQAAVSLENTALVQEIETNYLSTMKMLAFLLDAKDPDTYGHSQRVADISKTIATHIGLNDYDLKILNEAALLHDIGKIGISENILKKPDKLTNDEWEIIKRHPEIGYHALMPLKSFEEIRLIVRHHHERIDGKGYPDGLSGAKLDVKIKILGIADAVDAMASDRAYCKALSNEMIIEELIKNKDKQFDSGLADIMIDIIAANQFARR